MEDDSNKVITAHMVTREGPDEHAVAIMMQDIKAARTPEYYPHK